MSISTTLSFDTTIFSLPEHIQAEYSQVPLSSCTTFCSPLYTTIELLPSIHHSIQPLIICPGQNGEYCIIDGIKRFQLLTTNGVTQVMCCILITPLTNSERFLVRIALNSQRELSVQEQYTFFLEISKQFESSVSRRLLLLLKIHPKYQHAFTALKTCDDEVQNAVFQSKIHLEGVEALSRLCHEEQRVLCQLCTRFSLSLQMQRQLFEWLPEICYNQNCSMLDLFEIPVFKEILNDTRQNNPQQIQHLFHQIYIVRFPRLTETQKQWNHLCTSLNPDPQIINFQSDRFFEKDKISIHIQGSDSKRVFEAIQKLSELSLDQWHKLIHYQ